MKDVDKGFFERADSLINLANSQISSDIGRGKVSASFMYALSRFNVFVAACNCNNSVTLEKNKDEMIEYYTSEFKKMLRDNIDDYVNNFEKYMK